MTTVTSVSLCGPVWPFSPGDRLRIAKLRIPRARRIPMAVETRPTTRQGTETVFVDRFCDGIIGPSCEMLGPVRDGGHIVANTAPGCWGPMITPAIQGGHEVTLPVAVAGAEVGDAIAIFIRDISVTSRATSSGQRPHDRGPLQRRPVLRQGVREVRRRGRGHRGRGHRPRQRALRQLRRARRAVCVHERLHDRLRRRVARRRDRRPRPRRGVRPRRARLRRDPGALHPEPDPALRAARPRRRRHKAAAVHGSDRDHARDRPARLAQRRRLRRVPARRAAQVTR